MNAGERKQSLLRLGFTMLGSFAMATSVSAQSVLEEVVVTATKRETSLDRTPVAITAMSGEQLDRQGIRDAVDLAAFVPGLEIANTTGNLQIGLRGVSNDSFALARDAAIAYHVDGVFRGRQSGGNGAFLDVERVEVVKGPQGTLYGRNATAGSINVVTANPTQNFEGYAEAVAGNYNRRGGRAVVNVPVIEDKFAIRAAVLRDTRDGFFDNGPLIRNDYSDSDDTAARLKALITPTQNLSVLLTAEYQGRGGVGDGTQTLSGQGAVLKDLRNPYRIYLNTEGQRDDDLYTYSAEVNYELPGATLTYLGAYFDSSVYLLMDFDRTDVLPFPLSINVDSEQWSHELRLSSSTGGRFEWLVGAYLFDENVARINDVTVNASLRTLSLQPDFNVNSRAAFGQASWQLTDEVKLTAGARYTKDEKDERNTQSVRILNGVRTEVSASLASEWSSTDWTVGVDWTPTDATMLYAKVGTGFKSGGFNDPLQANLGANRIFAPEEILAYQIGHKTRLLGGTVRLSSEAYYYDYTDLQVSQSVQGGSAFTSNAADAEIYGVEVEMTAQPTDRLMLGLGVNYLEATFGDFVTYDSIERQMADLTGKRLARSPSWTFNAAARYVFDLPNNWTVVPGITFGYRDKSKLRFFEDRGSMQPEWTRTDVTLDFNSPTGAVLFQLFANNLEDDVVWTTAAVNPAGDRTLNVRPPTMYGARVRYNFGQ